MSREDIEAAAQDMEEIVREAIRGFARYVEEEWPLQADDTETLPADLPEADRPAWIKGFNDACGSMVGAASCYMEEFYP